MSSIHHRWRESVAPPIRRWWADYGEAVVRVAVVLSVAAALWRLGNELPRLLWEQDGIGAFDLRLRHREVHRWFAGLPVYGEVERGDYPPASYAILWPLLGWLPLAGARLFWAVTALVALGWLGWLCAREGVEGSVGEREHTREAGVGEGTRSELLLLFFLPFALYPASAALRVGQVIDHALPLLVGGLLVLRRGRGGWPADLLAAALLVASLVKPTLVAPFFWIVCFVPGRVRPIVLVSLGYALVTLLAASFQEGELPSILRGWLIERPQVLQGHANVHKWLALAGLRPLMLPASVAILATLALWVLRHRRSDLWTLAGVSGIVAHFWLHHRLYDDLLMIAPMIALFRIAHRAPPEDGEDVLAGVLFAAVWLTMLAPASLLGYPPPISTLAELAQTAVWLAALAFLLARARRETRATVLGAAAAH